MGPRPQHQQVFFNTISLRLVIADEYYYDKTLEQRRDILDTLDTSFLCKTIVFENTAYNPKYEVFFEV